MGKKHKKHIFIFRLHLNHIQNSNDKIENKISNRKYKLMMLFMSFQMNIHLHLTYTFHHLNDIIIFVRRKTKRETNEMKDSNSKLGFLKSSCSEILLYESPR